MVLETTVLCVGIFLSCHFYPYFSAVFRRMFYFNVQAPSVFIHACLHEAVVVLSVQCFLIILSP